MLRTAVGVFFMAMIASAVPAQAGIRVIYPPQSYQAPFEFCPRYWQELYTCGCQSFHHGHHRYHHSENYGLMGAATGIHIIRAGQAATVAMVLPESR